MGADRQNRTKQAAQANLVDGEPIVYRRRVPGFETIELLRGSDVTQQYPRHWHEEIYLCATLGGTSYLDYLGASLLARRGTLAIVAPGEIHTNRKVGCNFRCILMEFRALQSAVEQFVERSIPALSFRSGLIEDQRTTAQFLNVHSSLEDVNQELGGHELAIAFLYDFAFRHSTASLPRPHSGNENAAVRRTKHFLDEHYAERVSLHELARLTGLSAYHLNRSFCRRIGMPPHQYQVQVRILKAKSFLRRGLSISETASLVGFVDQSHLTRHFKRSVGVTPGGFLR